MRGGVNTWITEAYPTNFHHKYKSRLLVAGEQMSDYREVTDAEWSAIEAADATWVRPPQVFIDMWDEACRGYFQNTSYKYGQYNEETGYFELNEFTDIITEEAIRIYNVWVWGKNGVSFSYVLANDLRIRTAIPIITTEGGGDSVNLANLACFNTSIDTIRILVSASRTISSLRGAFNVCSIKHVLGVLRLASNCDVTYAFRYVSHLVTINIKGLASSINFQWALNLSYDSIYYMVNNRAGTNDITITVHPDVYAKLTGDTTNVAAAALDEEELESWMALVPEAADQNITFATST